MADEDLIIMVDSLDEPFDTTQEQPKPTDQPVRLKVPGRKTPDPTARTTTTTTTTTDKDADPVEDLRGQLNAARARATDAERRANEAAEIARQSASQVDRARTIVADTRITSLDNEIASANTESASIKAALKAAYDAGDFAKVSDLQEQQADVRARLLRAKDQKDAIERSEPITRAHEGAVRPPVQQQQRQQRIPQTREERREAILAGCTPKTRAWLENHPDCVDDPVRAAEAGLVHEQALAAGYTADSPEYFQFAEQKLGYTTVSKPKPNGGRLPRVEGAPVDRGGSAVTEEHGGGLRVELTQGEAKNATDGTLVWNYGPQKGKPIGLKEMARRKAIGMAEGKYNSAPVS